MSQDLITFEQLDAWLREQNKLGAEASAHYMKVLREEIDLLRKSVARLEASIDTWKALAAAWQFLAESKTDEA